MTLTMFNPCALGGAGENVALTGTVRIMSQEQGSRVELRLTGLGEVTNEQYSVTDLSHNVVVFPQRPPLTEYPFHFYFRFQFRGALLFIGKGQAANFTAEVVSIVGFNKGRGEINITSVSTRCS